MIPIALTIAGSDPGGGAGIQADLKTFHQLRVYGTSAVTLITVQNSTRMSRVEILDPGLVAEQIAAVLEDFPPLAAKTGALGNAAIVESIADRPFPCPLVVDPVMRGKHGAPLMDSRGCDALRELLLPRAALITPNLDEAALLSGAAVENADQMRHAAARIGELGAGAVLIKGGHLTGPEFRWETLDILYHEGVFTELRAARVETRHTHGTGCTYSAAITAFLARGLTMAEAVRRAHQFVHEAIRTSPGLGAGAGPLNYWANDSL